MTSRRLIVIGAGPVGLGAALAAVRRGWHATVLERGGIGESLKQWGPTRFFSPLAMNLPPGAAAAIGSGLPADDALLTGPEFVSRILEPLAGSPALAGRVRTGHRVVAAGRAGLTRSDFPGHPIRAERPFQLLIEAAGREFSVEADAVIDASGTYGQPVSIGAGGIPAPGERGVHAIRHLGDLHTNIERLRGKNVLLAGHGHSAAHALLLFAAHAPEIRVTWAIRSFHQRPFAEVPADPLPERSRVIVEANRLAQQPPAWLRIERRAAVEELTRTPHASLLVNLGRGRTVEVDEIVAFTGYRPDLSIVSELAIEIAPSTEGAARLTRSLASVTDCLSVPTIAPADLDSGEPGFHLAGSKSYGRARTFLLKNGYAQVETILDRLEIARAG